jgi:hypothetical protein
MILQAFTHLWKVKLDIDSGGSQKRSATDS